MLKRALSYSLRCIKAVSYTHLDVDKRQPSELDEKQIDWNEVNRMYQFIIERTMETKGKLQVIIVDHADLKEESFRKYICENWWPIDPVSYTHLDVYKRQPDSSGQGAASGPMDAPVIG